MDKTPEVVAVDAYDECDANELFHAKMGRVAAAVIDHVRPQIEVEPTAEELAWVRRHGFTVFAIYRILLGIALLIWGAFAFSQRVRNWERGAPDRRNLTKKNVTRRLKDLEGDAEDDDPVAVGGAFPRRPA